jgi:hypothetical protein
MLEGVQPFPLAEELTLLPVQAVLLLLGPLSPLEHLWLTWSVEECVNLEVHESVLVPL